MPDVTVTQTINAPIDQVWASIDDFANIDRFNPNLSRSFLINDSAPTGLGATRQCDLSDGKNYIQERVTVYEPPHRFVVDIYNGTVPLKQAEADFHVKAVGPSRTEVTMVIRFVPKFGLLGRLMTPLMKGQFRKSMAALLEGNRAYVEDGRRVDTA